MEINSKAQKISFDIENFKFNTAVSELMKLLNELEQLEPNTEQLENFLKLLAPFAPHITEELWATLGHKKSIHLSTWPEISEPVDKAEDKAISIPVQINGKVRSTLIISPATSADEIKKVALQSPVLSKWLAGKEVLNFIYKKNKVVNIVLRT